MLAVRAEVAPAQVTASRVRRRPNRRPASVGKVAAVFASLAVLLLLYVAEQAYIITLTYRLQEARAALHAAEVETDRLELRISELSAPARIERVAREQLHLVSPVQTAYLGDLPQVANVPAAEGDETRLPVLARLQRLWWGTVVQPAHAAE